MPHFLLVRCFAALLLPTALSRYSSWSASSRTTTTTMMIAINQSTHKKGKPDREQRPQTHRCGRFPRFLLFARWWSVYSACQYYFLIPSLLCYTFFPSAPRRDAHTDLLPASGCSSSARFARALTHSLTTTRSAPHCVRWVPSCSRTLGGQFTRTIQRQSAGFDRILVPQR